MGHFSGTFAYFYPWFGTFPGLLERTSPFFSSKLFLKTPNQGVAVKEMSTLISHDLKGDALFTGKAPSSRNELRN
jgi:hypothetical protein